MFHEILSLLSVNTIIWTRNRICSIILLRLTTVVYDKAGKISKVIYCIINRLLSNPKHPVSYKYQQHINDKILVNPVTYLSNLFDVFS